MSNAISTIAPVSLTEKQEDLYTEVIGIENPTELIKYVENDLTERGNKTAAQYVGMYYTSLVLEEQIIWFYESGKVDVSKLQQAGFDVMIELVGSDIVLTEDARLAFISQINVLKAELNNVITRRTREVASKNAEIMAKPKSFLPIIHKPEKGIPMYLSQQNTERLLQVFTYRYPDRKEAENTIRNLLLNILGQTPESIQLGSTASFANFLKNIVNNLSTNKDPKKDTERLSYLNVLMKDAKAVEELGVDTRILEEIHNKVYTKFSNLRGGKKVAVIPPE